MSLTHQIALTLIKGVGHITAKRLLDHFGTAEAVFAASAKALLQTEGISAAITAELLQTNALKLAEVQADFIRDRKIKALFYTDDDYPQRLKNCYDSPVLLYYKGTANLNHKRIVSVVGTRNASPQGLLLCRQLVKALQPYQVLIVSGLAYGIDVSAHQQSLTSHIPTVGVLAHGLDRLYPAAHRGTSVAMMANGGLLTEFPLHTMPIPANFPKRNRIIAGLADVTVVVEAALKGGALITADIANSYDRDVFAFPGRTTDEYAQGCNFLIKTNRAGLLSQAADLAYYMGWEAVIPIETPQELFVYNDLSALELKIVKALHAMPLRIDELGVKTGIEQSRLAMPILNLELREIIISMPGMGYRLL